MDSNNVNERKLKIETYQKQLLEAMSNSSLYLEILFEYVKYLTEDKQYDLIIKTLEEVVNENIVNSLDDRLKVIEKLITILLKIEDFIKLKSVLDHRQSFLTKENDLIMQKFYYAVCYEGLENYQEAIKVLLEIKDNISNQNLVNKYLKLSMIHLKIDDYLNADKYFKLAVKFDKSMKNPTFLLAECDLLISKKDYFKALEIYEEYFIRTKNRYRYLDRYININIELNRLSEAYNFYDRHKEIMKRVLSKQSRLQFYKSAIRLMKRLNNKSEEALLNTLIAEIDDSFTPLNNHYDFLINFIKENYGKQFLRERDIIHSLFSYVDKTKIFSKLVFVKLEDDQVKLMHYVKGLLLEKTLEAEYLESGIYAKIKNFESLSIYDRNFLNKLVKDPFKTEKTNYLYIAETSEFNYLVFYLESDNFYETKKIFDLINVVLKKLLNDLIIVGFNDKVLKNVLKITDSLDKAFLLLRDNTLYLLNNAAKELLEETKDYLSVEDFQSRLVKNIYVDELVKLDSLKIRYQGKQLKNINLEIFKDDLDLYLLAEIEKTVYTNRKFKSYNELSEETYAEDVCVILLNLRNYQDFLQGYNFGKYLDLLNEIYANLRTNSRNYFKNIYLEGMDNLYLVVSTRDKRIINRIIDALFSEFKTKIDIRGSILNVKDKIVEEDIENLKYLNSLTNLSQPVLQDNKNFRHNKEVFKTISLNVEKLLAENSLRLSYQPVVNWQTNTYRFIYVDVLNRVLLGNKTSLQKVLWANNLEVEWDNLMITQLLKDSRIANYRGEFLVEVSLEILTDKQAFDKFEKRLKNKNFSKSKVIYVVDYLEYKKYKDKVYLSKERLAFKNFMYNFSLCDVNDLNFANYLIFNHLELSHESYEYLLGVLKNFPLDIIYDHESNSLAKSFLKTKEVLLVLGDAYGKFDNLKAVKKLEE